MKIATQKSSFVLCQFLLYNKTMRFVCSLILIFFSLSASAQIFVPFSFWQPKRGGLTISDGATYDYGTVAAGANVDKVFTLTNTSYAAVNSIVGAAFTGANPATFTFKGGTFPGTGGDCGTTLVGFGVCTFVVTANNGTAATHTATVNINYNDGVTTQTATRALSATFTTTPTRLVWVSAPSYIKFNTCTQLTVQAQDNSGTAINVSPAVTVSLAINNTNNPVYYTSNTCATSTTSITISAGTNSQNVWIKTTVANESGIIVASGTGLVLKFVVYDEFDVKSDHGALRTVCDDALYYGYNVADRDGVSDSPLLHVVE